MTAHKILTQWRLKLIESVPGSWKIYGARFRRHVSWQRRCAIYVKRTHNSQDADMYHVLSSFIKFLPRHTITKHRLCRHRAPSQCGNLWIEHHFNILSRLLATRIYFIRLLFSSMPEHEQFEDFLFVDLLISGDEVLCFPNEFMTWNFQLFRA